MTLLGIDHLVVAVTDVEQKAADLEAELGLAFTGGGRHETMGTCNRLAFLGDTYLELIGVFNRALVLSSTAFAVGNAALAMLDAGREGLATYALATDDIAADAWQLRADGSPIGEPVSGSRRRADGETVRWISAFPALGPQRAPFLIEHEHTGAEWGDDARAARAVFRHPVGGRVRLAALELPVGDPDAVAAEYLAVVGVRFAKGHHAVVGEQEIRLLAAAQPADVPVVRFAGEAEAPPLDTVRLGVRWLREPAGPTVARPGSPSTSRSGRRAGT